MSYARKILVFIYIILTLLLNTQAYSVIEQEFTAGAGFCFHAFKYYLVTPPEQKQNPEKYANAFTAIVKYTINDSDGLLCGLSLKNHISIFRYYSISKTIFINFTSVVIVFPFHFFW